MSSLPLLSRNTRDNMLIGLASRGMSTPDEAVLFVPEHSTPMFIQMNKRRQINSRRVHLKRMVQHPHSE